MIYKDAVNLALERDRRYEVRIFRRAWADGFEGKVVGRKLVLPSDYWLTEADTAAEDWVVKVRS